MRCPYIGAVRGPRMEVQETSDGGQCAVAAVLGMPSRNEAEEQAAIDCWKSLPREERHRILVEYSNRRMRQERLSYIP